jgi:hypothetical protein
MITNPAIRKELKEVKEKISLMSHNDVVKYMKDLLLQMSKILNKENALLRKRKYAQIKENDAWLKFKITNIVSYCFDTILKFTDNEYLKNELIIIDKSFTQVMESLRENELHLMRVRYLQEMAVEIKSKMIDHDMAVNFGYDQNSKHVSEQDPIKYSKVVNINQYT